jgi:hypothetical protein
MIRQLREYLTPDQEEKEELDELNWHRGQCKLRHHTCRREELREPGIKQGGVEEILDKVRVQKEPTSRCR